jgi:hypothetical protein
MKLAVVLSTHATQFGDVVLKGDFDANVSKIAGWGYDGAELKGLRTLWREILART